MGNVVDAVNSALHEQGLFFTQSINNKEVTTTIHDSMSEGAMYSFLQVPELPQLVKMADKGTGFTAQDWGSLITYAKRYALMMACGLYAEDDDAASASGKPSAPVQFAGNKTQAPQSTNGFVRRA